LARRQRRAGGLARGFGRRQRGDRALARGHPRGRLRAPDRTRPRMSSSLRRLLSQLQLDALLTVRHRFLHVMLGMALLFGVLVRFALPDTLEHRAKVYVVDASDRAATLPGTNVLPDRA